MAGAWRRPASLVSRAAMTGTCPRPPPLTWGPRHARCVLDTLAHRRPGDVTKVSCQGRHTRCVLTDRRSTGSPIGQHGRRRPGSMMGAGCSVLPRSGRRRPAWGSPQLCSEVHFVTASLHHAEGHRQANCSPSPATLKGAAKGHRQAVGGRAKTRFLGHTGSRTWLRSDWREPRRGARRDVTCLTRPGQLR